MSESEKPQRRPTIRDVAKHAQVSRAAVSKVLNNAYGVSDDMRAKVAAAIEALEFRPLVSARGLRGSTYRIGVMLPDFENEFFSEVLRGATEELLTTDYQFILAPIDDVHFDGRLAIESLVDYRVDGIVAVAPLAGVEWLESIAARIPLVELGRHDKPRNYDTVVGDDAAGAGMVMDHLLGLGHRRIVHLTQIERDRGAHVTSTTAIRRRVYLDRMRQAGFEQDIAVIEARFVEHAAYEGMASYLATEALPSAVFAGNDQAAKGVLRALAERNLRSVATVGYDNTPIASHPYFDLSSVDQDAMGVGRTAIQLLLERLDGRTKPVHRIVQPRLIIRSSSSGPAS